MASESLEFRVGTLIVERCSRHSALVLTMECIRIMLLWTCSAKLVVDVIFGTPSESLLVCLQSPRTNMAMSGGRGDRCWSRTSMAMSGGSGNLCWSILDCHTVEEGSKIGGLATSEAVRIRDSRHKFCRSSCSSLQLRWREEDTNAGTRGQLASPITWKKKLRYLIIGWLQRRRLILRE